MNITSSQYTTACQRLLPKQTFLHAVCFLHTACKACQLQVIPDLDHGTITKQPPGAVFLQQRRLQEELNLELKEQHSVCTLLE
jgi:hypothetical protein